MFRAKNKHPVIKKVSCHSVLLDSVVIVAECAIWRGITIYRIREMDGNIQSVVDRINTRRRATCAVRILGGLVEWL